MDNLKKHVVDFVFGFSFGGWLAVHFVQVNIGLQACAALVTICVGLYTLRYRRAQIRALDKTSQESGV